MIERRSSRRVAYQAEGHVDGPHTSRTPARVAELGADGAYMDSPATLPVGHRAVLSFTLIDRELTAEIEVIYSVPGRGMGVRFINLSPAERSLIKSIVEA